MNTANPAPIAQFVRHPISALLVLLLSPSLLTSLATAMTVPADPPPPSTLDDEATVATPISPLRRKVLVVIDETFVLDLAPGLQTYFEHVGGLFHVDFDVLAGPVLGMKPVELRARLAGAFRNEPDRVIGAIMVGPIPVALRGIPGTIVFPTPYFYEDFDARWTDADGDGIFEKVETDRTLNATEIWTAWWVPPANDAKGQIGLLKGWLEKLDRHYRALSAGKVPGRDGAVYIAGNGNSVEITEAWTVLLSDALATAGQRVATVHSLQGQMKQARLPDPGPEFRGEDLVALLTSRAWQHVHILTHGSPAGFYWRNGETKVAVTTENFDFSRFHETGPVIFTTSGCSNGVFRGTLKAEPDYARSMGNRLLFDPRTVTVAYFGSASPQSASVFAGFHTEIFEALTAGKDAFIAEGYKRFRNTDHTWGLEHFIFRGMDGKILNGDPFARYAVPTPAKGTK